MKSRWIEHEVPENRDIRDEILRMLLSMKSGDSICPSDAARAFGSKWRQLMPQVREVAADMVREGSIIITQQGQLIDVDEREIESIKGPIRLSLRPKQN